MHTIITKSTYVSENLVGLTHLFYLIFGLGKFQHGLPAQKLASSLGDTAAEAAHYFTLSEIEDATKNFERKIGSGGFGVVYYGRLKDGKEIAVKILTNDSFQGKREFSNEVYNIIINLSCFYYS